jgi:hypothetical protein
MAKRTNDHVWMNIVERKASERRDVTTRTVISASVRGIGIETASTDTETEIAAAVVVIATGPETTTDIAVIVTMIEDGEARQVNIFNRNHYRSPSSGAILFYGKGVRKHMISSGIVKECSKMQ